MIHLSGLHIYPVKSLAGITLSHSEVDEFGLLHDRRWMLVDENNQFLTQRTLAVLSQIQVDILPDGIQLFDAQQQNIIVPRPESTHTRVVQVWQDTCQSLDAGDAVAAWLNERIKQHCRLVYFPANSIRQIDPNYAKPNEKTAFSDGFPLLLISQASLDDLNQRLAKPVSMSRFRPNLVVAGCEAFAEDCWQRIRIGDIEMRLVKPCSRCTIPNIDPITAAQSKEPILTLSRYRKRENKVYFGQNIIADSIGQLNVGMEVEILG